MSDTTRPPRTHKNAAGVEFVTVRCPVCYYQHAHTVEAEAAAPDAGITRTFKDAILAGWHAPDMCAAPDAGLRKALAAMIDHHDNTTDHDDCQVRWEARAALADDDWSDHVASVPENWR